MERDDEKLLKKNLGLTNSEQVKNAPQTDKIHPELPSKERGVKTLLAFSNIWWDPVRSSFMEYSHTRPIRGLMFCYRHLEILDDFLTRGLHFHFALGLTDYGAGLELSLGSRFKLQTS